MEERLVEKKIGIFYKILPPSMQTRNIVVVLEPSKVEKNRMVDQLYLSLVFWFIGWIPNHYEFLHWLQGFQVSGHKVVVNSANYLDKGFYLIIFYDENNLREILWKVLFFYNRVRVCAIP